MSKALKWNALDGIAFDGEIDEIEKLSGMPSGTAMYVMTRQSIYAVYISGGVVSTQCVGARFHPE